LIGGSIALSIKRRWPDATVVAIDRPHVVEAALAMRAADCGGPEPGDAGGADLVMLAAPILQNVAAMHELPAHVPHAAVVTDAGSTKRVMMEAAAGLPARLQFIGGHPLAGAAISGLEAARPDLFDDRPWILTARDDAPAGTIDRLEEFVRGLRAMPHRMDAAEHDRLLAYISHLPQLAVSALMHVVGNHAGAEGLPLAGRGLRDTTRLASSPAATWADIVATNRDNISQALEDLITALQQLNAEPASEVLERTFTSAARWKGLLEHG
jgi:prephenate dehydrogenase